VIFALIGEEHFSQSKFDILETDM